MPKVTQQIIKPPKQVAVPAEKVLTGTVLDRIAPISNHGGVKLNVYGRGKTGKTRLACSFPKPLLLVGTEDGTKSVAKVKGVRFVRLYNSEELGIITEMLKGGSFKTMVLDTAGGLQDMMMKELKGWDEMPVQRSFGMAERGDWMQVGTWWKERIRALVDLAENTSLNVVIIAHERNFTEENSGDLMLPTVGAALTPTVAAWLNGAVDYVCQTFIRQVEEEVEVELAGIKQVMIQKTNKAEYCLRVGPHPIFVTGFRLPDDIVLPDVIVDPTFDKINALIQGD